MHTTLFITCATIAIEIHLNPVISVHSQSYRKPIKYGITGRISRCHRDMCFPGMHVSHTRIPRDACFPTRISLKQQLATSHSDMCVPVKYVSPEISLNFTSSPQFKP